jgi:hypothetical protein
VFQVYFFYVDESGNRDTPFASDGSNEIVKDWLYVLTAVCVLDHKWSLFDTALSRRKLALIEKIRSINGSTLDLANAELKSNWVRNLKERQKRPFIKDLSNDQLVELVYGFYQQLSLQNMHLFSVVVDKRHLYGYMEQQKLQRKAWELLLESVEWYMRSEHPRHKAIMIADDPRVQSHSSTGSLEITSLNVMIIAANFVGAVRLIVWPSVSAISGDPKPLAVRDQKFNKERSCIS